MPRPPYKSEMSISGLSPSSVLTIEVEDSIDESSFFARPGGVCWYFERTYGPPPLVFSAKCRPLDVIRSRAWRDRIAREPGAPVPNARAFRGALGNIIVSSITSRTRTSVNGFPDLPRIRNLLPPGIASPVPFLVLRSDACQFPIPYPLRYTKR